MEIGFKKLQCPLDWHSYSSTCFRRREKQRGNRMIGSARAQYYQVHKGVAYDLEFDTNKGSSEKIIQAIKERLCPKNQ